MSNNLPILTGMTREAVADLFKKFVNQRVEFDPNDYEQTWQGIIDLNTNRETANRDGRRANKALVEFRRLPYLPKVLAEGLNSSRLELTENGVHYTAGQYYPLEVRNAVAWLFIRYNQAARPKPPMVPAPQLDALYQELAELPWEENKKLRKTVRPTAPYYVTALDTSLCDRICVPAMGLAEAQAIKQYIQARAEMTAIRTKPVTAARGHDLILDWRYHALDALTPEPEKNTELQRMADQFAQINPAMIVARESARQFLNEHRRILADLEQVSVQRGLSRKPGVEWVKHPIQLDVTDSINGYAQRHVLHHVVDRVLYTTNPAHGYLGLYNGWQPDPSTLVILIGKTQINSYYALKQIKP